MTKAKRNQGNLQVGGDPKRFSIATASQNITQINHRLNELMNSIASIHREKPEDAEKTAESLMSSLEAIAPSDELESMLAEQMVATNSAAMECLRRAAFPDQHMQARDMNLKNASKILALYVRQMEALDKHRGRGAQKITVEHVTVEAGGQAIVGSVSTGANEPRDALAYDPENPMPMVESAQSDATLIKKPRRREKEAKQ